MKLALTDDEIARKLAVLGPYRAIVFLEENYKGAELKRRYKRVCHFIHVIREESIHSSHRLTKWKTEIRSPAGTARFYSVRHCKDCDAEEMRHAAGHFGLEQLQKECSKVNT